RARPSIRPCGGQCVETAHRRDDPPADRDLLALEAVRVSEPIPALVVRPHHFDHRERERDRREDLSADRDVTLNAEELLRGQLPGLLKMWSGMPSFPMSCTSAPVATASSSGPLTPAAFASAVA